MVNSQILPAKLKRLLSMGFFAAVVFFAVRTCEVESAECNIVFEIRSQEFGVERMQVWLYDVDDLEMTGAVLSEYHRRYGNGPKLSLDWPITIVSGWYRIRGEVFTDDGRVDFSQTVELSDGDVAVVDVNQYLQ